MWESRSDALATTISGAEAALVAESVIDSIFSLTQQREEEGDLMPASAVTPGADVNCGTSAWARLDSVPRAGRTRIGILNPNGVAAADTSAYRIGICFTATDTVPAAATPPDVVIEGDYGILPPEFCFVTEGVRVWGKSLGATAMNVRFTQFGN